VIEKARELNREIRNIFFNNIDVISDVIFFASKINIHNYEREQKRRRESEEETDHEIH
jgi:hypothetical protein